MAARRSAYLRKLSFTQQTRPHRLGSFGGPHALPETAVGFRLQRYPPSKFYSTPGPGDFHGRCQSHGKRTYARLTHVCPLLSVSVDLSQASHTGHHSSPWDGRPAVQMAYSSLTETGSPVARAVRYERSVGCQALPKRPCGPALPNSGRTKQAPSRSQQHGRVARYYHPMVDARDAAVACRRPTKREHAALLSPFASSDPIS